MSARKTVFAALLLGSMGGASWAEESPVSGNVNFHIVSKQLDEDEWEPVDSQSGFAIEGDMKGRSWPISIAAGYQKTDASELFSGLVVEGETTELSLGVKWIYEEPKYVRPFIGGGATQIKAEFAVPSLPGGSGSDTGTGFYIAGGVYWTLADHFNIGLSARVSQADVTIFGVDADAGGTSGTVFAGFHF